MIMARKNIKRPRLNSRKRRKLRLYKEQEQERQAKVKGIKEAVRLHEGAATFEEALIQGRPTQLDEGAVLKTAAPEEGV
jgi:hypothetical protein